MPESAEVYLKRLEIAHKVSIRDGSFTTTDLSTGQRKRLALINAWLEERPVLVFDEWAADQDPTFRRIFYTELLPELKRLGKTIIVISHDDRYFDVADQLVRMEPVGCWSKRASPDATKAKHLHSGLSPIVRHTRSRHKNRSAQPAHSTSTTSTEMPTHLRLNHLTRALGLRRAFNAQLPALALTLALPLAAQAQDQQLTLNIPAQPLSSALQKFAELTDVQVLYEPGAVQNLRSGALSGRHSLDQSVRILLGESGLRYQLRDNTLTLQASNEGDSAMLLDATSIQSAALGATTENTGSYTTGVTSTATRLGLSPRETPQSVSVVTRQQMDDQNMQSLEDVAMAATGINTVKGFGTERPLYYSRGFQVDDLQVDGLPTSVTESFSMDVMSVNNMAMYDRVEIVRGANGLLQGAGSPSAAINMVRKRPTRSYQLKAEIGAGSWDNYRTQLDVGGPLNAEGTLRVERY